MREPAGDDEVERIVGILRRRSLVGPRTRVVRRLAASNSRAVVFLGDDRRPEWVLKLNGPEETRAEGLFLEIYGGTISDGDVSVGRSPLIPPLKACDSALGYVLYPFIPADGAGERPAEAVPRAGAPHPRKLDVLVALCERLINRYVPAREAEARGWGYLQAPHAAWSAFLEEEVVDEASASLADVLAPEDHRLVRRLARSPRRQRSYGYFLHGDCGVHNFLFRDGQLVAVLDPGPLVGEPVYDLVFAFCSKWPDELSPATIEAAADALDPRFRVEPDVLHEEVVIGLYARIAACLEYHRRDLPAYLEAWRVWRRRLEG